MAAAGKEGEIEAAEDFVYRISTADEWEQLRNSGYIFGGELDKTSGFIHLSDLHQVQSTLQNFFLNSKVDLYLLQIDAKKLGDGLIYELVDGSNRFPHFYGPSRSFIPLPLSAVTKAEKLLLSVHFGCFIEANDPFMTDQSSTLASEEKRRVDMPRRRSIARV